MPSERGVFNIVAEHRYNAETSSDTDIEEEMIDVLIAISVVSKRIAHKLRMLAEQETKGGQKDVKNERFDDSN